MVRRCSQSKVPVCKRKELEYFQVESRTGILLWEEEAEKGNRKRLLEVIKSRYKDIRVLEGHLQGIDVT